LIFKGTAGETGKILKAEQHLYDSRVTVDVNPTAYNNEVLLSQQLRDEVIPLMQGQDTLLTMDVATFHKTPRILDQLTKGLIQTALIPPGCTGLLQPLDVSVNKPFKGYLRDELDALLLEMEERKERFDTVSSRRILTTKMVASAWEKMHADPRVIIDSFIHTGININPNGADDHLIRIKDHPVVDFTGWEIRDDIVEEQIKEEAMKPVYDNDHEFEIISAS
jgi:DDE superfamily endonuclease